LSSSFHKLWLRLETFTERALARLNADGDGGRSTLGPTALILILSLLASGLASWVTYRSTVTTQQTRFDLLSRRVADEVANIMAPYSLILRAGAGLFSAQRNVDADRWRQFVATIDLQRNYPGIQGLGFSRVLKSSEIDTHIAKMRAAWPDYEFRPKGQRDVYTSIDFLEPRNWRNDRAVGYDMYSEPIRREAMDEARLSGNPRMTHAITLMQETDQDRQRGVLVYMPVFDNAGVASSDEDETQPPLIGYVYAAFRLRDLFESNIRSQWPTLLSDVSVRVYDKPESAGGELLFDSLQPGTTVDVSDEVASKLSTRIARNVAGRTWELSVSARDSFFSPWEAALPWLVLGGGIAISLLVSGIAGTMAVARKQAVEAQLVLEDEVKTRKAAQAALEISNRDVLISNQELVHRVKNMMAVVSSIATQTARYTPDPNEFNGIFRERLAALGRVHEFLKPNPGFRPDLAELVPEILAPYAAPNGKQLVINGVSIPVSQSNAILLSVVINELAANAVRHGAWTSATGVVTFEWSIASGENSRSRINFRWAESGGPPVTAPVRKGFGTNVLRFSVEQGLKGTFATRFNPDGLVCEWSIPYVTGGGGEIDRVY